MTSATNPPLTDGVSPSPASRPDRLYPTLSPAQLARIAPHGRRRQVAQGEVLVHAGESATRIFVVLAGRIDVIRPSATEEVVVSFSSCWTLSDVGLELRVRALPKLNEAAVPPECTREVRSSRLARGSAA